MYFDLASDWPAYIFIAIFIAFVAYVIVNGNSGGGAVKKTEDAVTKK
jgi:hypothetical protein